MDELKEIRNIRKEQFDVLHRISRMLNAAILPENLVDKALDLIVDVIHAERALFVKYNETSDDFSIIGARNIQQKSIPDLREFSSGILQQVIKLKKTCFYHDVQSDPQISQFESVQIQKIKSVLGVPIFRNEKIWGVILADSRGSRQEFTEDNLLFLEFFANLVSLALDKILSFEIFTARKYRIA